MATVWNQSEQFQNYLHNIQSEMFHDLVCRICLAIGVKMYDMETYKLNPLYQDITGDWLSEDDLRFACYECSALLYKFSRFKEKCLKSQMALNDALALNGGNFKAAILVMDRQTLGLASKLSVRAVETLDSDVASPPPSPVDVKEEAHSDGDVASETGDLKCDDVSFEDTDDLPLINIKKEVKQEKENSSPPKRRKKERKEKREKAVAVRKRVPWRDKSDSSCADFANVITLSHEDQVNELLKRKESPNYINSPFKCDFCYKGFIHRGAFDNHSLLHEPVSGNYVCSVCKLRARTARLLRWHVKCSHAHKYTCKKCEHICNTAAQAKYHERWHNGFIYQCQYCGKTFTKPTTYFTHVRLSHPSAFVCSLCGESFVNENGLIMHKRRSHRDKQLPPEESDAKLAKSAKFCDECDINFESEVAWRRHMATSIRHQDNDLYKNSCHMCGVVCGSMAQLSGHIVTHHKKSEKPRKEMTVIKKRLNRLDTKLSVKCTSCDKTFVSASRAQAHHKRIHLGQKYNKYLVCEVCGKDFKSQTTLSVHHRTHTDERPFPCSMCDKAFRDSSALYRHTRAHTGVKPYQCVHCGKSFSQSNSLKMHIHTVHLKLPAPYKKKKKIRPNSANTA